MDELTLDGETYVSTKRAAKITGYAKDYVGQLCREGRVNARLVGRNWYVLESSIKEHRFGEEQATNVQNGPELEPVASNPEGWQPSQYEHEPVSELPVFNRDNVNHVDLDTFLEEDDSYVQSSEVVQEMQSAWQDWFRREKQEEIAAENTGDADEPQNDSNYEENKEEPAEEIAETPEEPVQIIKNEPEEEIPVAIHREIEEEPVREASYEPLQASTTVVEDESEQVPVYRSYARPEPIQRPQMPMPTRIAASSHEDFGMNREANGRIYKANKKLKRNQVVIRESNKASNLWRFIFVLIMLAGIFMAFAGSGFFDTYFKQDSPNSFPFQFLGGERVINK